MNSLKVSLLGGDLRQAALAGFMAGRGADVRVFGISPLYLPDNITVCRDLECITEAAETVILPLPVSGDGIYLNCPLDSQTPPVKLVDILKLCREKRVFGGRCSPAVKKRAEDLGVSLIDYFDSEELKIANSVLAAEGALSVAMNELKVSVFGSRSAVVGYGRIGRALSPMLKSLGSRVTVAARKSTDLAWADASGFDTLRLNVKDGKSSLCALASGYDVIFNTVPYWLFDENVLSCFKGKRDCILIDLASAPGGVDTGAAERFGINVIKALSLPGRYAPYSAGRIIGECIMNILDKEK